MKKIILSLFFLITNFYSISAQNEPKKLLAIFAHPDDEQSVAPLLVKLVEESVEVTLVIATDGRLGVNEYNDNKAGDGLAKIRRKEMMCAADILGVKLIHLDYHDQLKAAEGFDGHVPHAQKLILELKNIIDKVKPDAIITFGPDGKTTHMDHRLVGASVTQVFLSQRWGKPMKLYFHGMPSDLLGSEKVRTLRGQERSFLNVQIPFTWDQYDKAYQSLLCHESQYPAEVVMKMKEDKKSFGNRIYLRQFMSSKKVKNRLF